MAGDTYEGALDARQNRVVPLREFDLKTTGDALVTKLDTVTTRHLMTTAEKDKLAALEGSHYLGSYPSVGALTTAHPSASPGDYADVDTGIGTDVTRYIWDDDDDAFVAQTAGAGSETAASVKTKLESNPDTNTLDDAQLAKVVSAESNATADQTAAEIATLIGAESGIHLVNDAQLALITNAATIKITAIPTDGVETTFTVAHGISGRNIRSSIRRVSDGGEVLMNITENFTGSSSFAFGSAPASGAYELVTVGRA